MRILKPGFVILTLLIALSGCFSPFGDYNWQEDDNTFSGSDDPIAPPATQYAVTVDWNDKATGAKLTPGMDVTFTWDLTPIGSLVRLELFRNNAQYDSTLLNYAADTGTQTWTVPLDIELHDADLFQVKLTVYDGTVQTKILDERYTPAFQIVRAGNNAGLSDVTVDAKSISITLIDDGSVVDGDCVDLFLNGVKVIDNHSLVGGAGTVFTLNLLSGSNELRVTALNEGTSSPNTAQLILSDVTVGATLQSWRLLTGESGSLVIYCTQP